jgi:hypothetical protein
MRERAIVGRGMLEHGHLMGSHRSAYNKFFAM